MFHRVSRKPGAVITSDSIMSKKPSKILRTIPILAILAATSGWVGCTAPRPGIPPANAPAGGEPGAAPAYDARLSTYAYPYPVKFRQFEAQQQSLEMAYMDVAPAKPNGRTVLLLHGKNFSGAYWGSTIVALSQAGYRVVVPDQIGFGKSTKPEHFQYTFQALATFTRELLDDLQVRNVTVVGHSMGGMLATRFALMYPERVRQLALVNPIGLEDWKLSVPYRPIAWWYQRELEQTPEKIRAYMRASYFGNEWRAAYDPLVDIQAGWTRGPDYERVAWNSALTYDMIFTQPVVYEFRALQVPTLLIIGQRDRTALGKALVPDAIAKTLGDYPELGKQAAGAIPHAQLVELDGVGHIPQFEAFNRYIDVLSNFLATTETANE